MEIEEGQGKEKTENKYVSALFQIVKRVAKTVEQDVLAAVSPDFGGGLMLYNSVTCTLET